MPKRDAPSFDDASTLLQSKIEQSPRPDATFSLTVVQGPDQGSRFSVDGSRPTHLVGHSAVCDMRLSDREASRRHAELELLRSRLRVRDLGSTNGTFVDGLAIVEAFLEGGETLRIGSTLLRVDRSNEKPAGEISVDTSFGRIFGASREMRQLYPLCQKLAASTVPLIIEGETGTGKEVLAEAIHDQGPRRGGPFVVFDCTAVPANLLESELFGHERGAFTGAATARAGVFEQAHGGTLLLDEIGDLELSLQAKLLRAVERSEVRRVGSNKWLSVDVRIVSATRRDLDQEVQAGRFRDDLLYRLAVGRIELPPLRRRKGDVPLLIQQFAAELGGAFPKELLARWSAYTWPGNIRELRNAVARQLALGEDVLGEMASSSGRPGRDGDAIERILAMDLPLLQGRRLVIGEYERRYIQRILDAHGGNVVHAARASGIARRYFQLLRSRTRA
jgi:two-component system, NtrC family, response regulator HydG